MKSFFQLSEQAKRHRLLREADAAPAVNVPGVKEAEPAKAVANQQTQNQQDNASSAVSFPEMEDVDLVSDFQKKLKNVVDDKANAAALVKMKEISATQEFSTQLTNALAELQKAVSKLQSENKQKKSSKQMNPAAGSNETGAGASAPAPAAPPTATPAAPPTQAAPV